MNGAAASAAGQSPPSAEQIEAGRRFFARECRFATAASQPDGLPPPGRPEVAFAGRSNVGKSSLINALTGRRSLARVSNTPGRTQQINFFDLGGRLVLVDLPGYGFAKAPPHLVDAWTRLVQAYLRHRVVLRRACLLVDARHGLKESDRTMMRLLDEAAVPYQLILTKADKLSGAATAQLVAAVAAEASRHAAAHPEIIPVSSHDGQGLAELRAVLASLADSAPEETR